MKSPGEIELPFVAYGIFKPGELGYYRLADFVRRCQRVEIDGVLRIRDGLPILDTTEEGRTAGVLIQFQPGSERQAYARIGALEPDRQYRWAEVWVSGAKANTLVGRSPKKGSIIAEDEWDGKEDPLFTTALDVIEEALRSNEQFEWDLKPMFRLQMAYLLLWSAIERYVSFRFHLGDRVMEKVNSLADDASFLQALASENPPRREVFRSHQPDQKAVLDATSPKKAIDYYYQIRSNITHRGKGVVHDHERLHTALSQLLRIFRSTLQHAFAEARANSA